jgi:7-cyano-7-deazaguanine synthase
MKSVVLLSGGLDSTVLLARLIADGHECLALSVLYGQRHRREVEAAASARFWMIMSHLSGAS